MLKKIFVTVLILIMVLGTCTSVFALPSLNAPFLSLTESSYAQAVQALNVKIPALMYHKVTDDPEEVSPYVITGEMLAADFAEIKRRGFTPITVSEYYEIQKLAQNMNDEENYKLVADFFKANPKPIIITFDDGYKGIYTHVLPLMEEYGFKVCFYICGELIDTQNPEYCTWDDIRALAECELAEIGNHTYSLHEWSKPKLNFIYQYDFWAALDDINYNKEVIGLQAGVDANVFSFPYGQYDPVVLQQFRENGYDVFVSTDFRVNRIGDKELALGRFNRDTDMSVNDYFNFVERKCNEW